MLSGLGVKTNLTDGTNWQFIAAFLLIRIFALVACALASLLHRGTLGDAMAHWICTTWISTVILGVPILSATLGVAYAYLAILAGVSSFIFQLPVMLVLLELHWSASPQKKAPDPESGQATVNATKTTHVRWHLLGHRLLHNHILWAIAMGLVLSLSTVGWKYLDVPTSKQFVPELGFVAAWLELLGRTAEPLALFATGTFFAHRVRAWRSAQPTTPARPPLIAARCAVLVAYMVAKLLLVPMLAVGCAVLVGLQGAYGRALVLLAVLPISPAAFALCSEYDVRVGDVGWNVAAGTLLMLPATIGWLATMDAIGLFTVS